MDKENSWAGTNIEESVPIWHKQNLTLKEASEYSNIGMTRLKEIIKKYGNQFVLRNGRKILINRQSFEGFMNSRRYI